MLSISDVMEMKRRNDVDGLIRALQYQGDTAVRAEAASSLGGLGDRGAVEPLISSLQADSDPYVRSLAAKALGDLGDPRAREALMNCIEKDTIVVGLAASKAQLQLEANIARKGGGEQQDKLASDSAPQSVKTTPHVSAPAQEVTPPAELINRWDAEIQHLESVKVVLMGCGMMILSVIGGGLIFWLLKDYTTYGVALGAVGLIVGGALWLGNDLRRERAAKLLADQIIKVSESESLSRAAVVIALWEKGKERELNEKRKIVITKVEPEAAAALLADLEEKEKTVDAMLVFCVHEPDQWVTPAAGAELKKLSKNALSNLDPNLRLKEDAYIRFGLIGENVMPHGLWNAINLAGKEEWAEARLPEEMEKLLRERGLDIDSYDLRTYKESPDPGVSFLWIAAVRK